jgi:hypothetical protein
MVFNVWDIASANMTMKLIGTGLICWHSFTGPWSTIRQRNRDTAVVNNQCRQRRSTHQH